MNNYVEQVKDCKIKYRKVQHIENNILLSVVIPTYKREKLLKEALLSVAPYSVKYPNVEVIILSNDSNDEFTDLCLQFKDLPFSVINNEKNLGMCGNINKCLLVAKGEFISYLHDDDILTKDFLPQMLSAIKENKDADCIIPARYVLTGNDEWGKQMQNKQLIKHMLRMLFFVKKQKNKLPYRITVEDIYRSGRNCFGAPSCGTTFKKKSIIEAGGFPTEWKFAFDFVFFEKFCRSYKVILLKESLGLYRMTESASNKDEVQMEFFKAQKYLLERNIKLPIIKKQYYEYLHLFAKGLSKNTQKLIYECYGDEMKMWNVGKYILLRIKTEIFYFSSGIDNERYLSNRKKRVLLGDNI